MARTLEALKQAEANRRLVAVAPSSPPAATQAASPTAAVEEIPFIEVGGRGVVVAASATVLATGPVTRAKAPARKGPPAPPADGDPAVVAAGEGPSVPVGFRPLPLAAWLPPAGERFARELVAFHQPEHALSEQYRSLLSGLSAQLPAGRSQVLLFTSGSSEAGKTTVLLNLALTAARQEKARVAVVDVGASQPTAAERLGLPEPPGLQEVLSGAMPLQAALQESGQPNLQILTAGESGSAKGAWTTSEGVRPVLQRLREHFDLVFVNGAAWDGGPAMAALGAACDVVYLVVRQAEARTPEIEDLLFRIPQRGGRLAGYILTQP